MVGSVLPCVAPRSDTEITSQDVEGQEGAETEDPLQEPKGPRESSSNTEEAKELQEEEDKTDEELKEINSGKGSNSKELCWIFILHAVNVILGVAAFAFLHETSTELVTAETKVNDANKINLIPVINISSISSTHRHSHNRTMSQGQGRK